jgi:hypothetical protein
LLEVGQGLVEVVAPAGFTGTLCLPKERPQVIARGRLDSDRSGRLPDLGDLDARQGRSESLVAVFRDRAGRLGKHLNRRVQRHRGQWGDHRDGD